MAVMRKILGEEKSDARDAEKRGQDVGGCSEPTCGQLVNRENSIVYSRGFIPHGTGIYISNKICCNHGNSCQQFPKARFVFNTK